MEEVRREAKGEDKRIPFLYELPFSASAFLLNPLIPLD